MRIFSGAVLAALAADSGEERGCLIRFDFSSGPFRISTGSRALVHGGQTRVAVGGGFARGRVGE